MTTTVERIVSETKDRFPIRVLAVDDDSTSLSLLEALLRQCHCHVTTISEASAALGLLRENKYNFDLVIVDIYITDMSGFKFLDLVGFRMNMPVIMLSASDDTKLVMKGFRHGAFDYLLKPVRIEELKKILQDVVRRKGLDRKDQCNSDGQDKPHADSSEAAEIGNVDNDGKFNKKRKDQTEVEDEEHDENGHDNEDPSPQKKPRVVWSEEFSRQFIAAFKRLGLERNVDNNGKLNIKRIDQNEGEDAEHDNKDPSLQNKPSVVWTEELSREFIAAFNQLGIERNVNNNEDHHHTLSFVNHILNCLPCNVCCRKICDTQALECEYPNCNFTVHWKCLLEQGM